MTPRLDQQNPKDLETGRSLPKNEFWKARGTKPVIPAGTSPELLWAVCEEYFQWVTDNPLHAGKIVSFQGTSTLEAEPRMRAMSLGALCLFIGISRGAWENWKRERPLLADTIAMVEEVIRTQKFEGAAGGILNAGIISRDIGLSEKVETTGGITLVVSQDEANL